MQKCKKCRYLFRNDMKMNDDLNNYLPSLLNPRSVIKDKRSGNLTQISVNSRYSLSLKRNSGLAIAKEVQQKVYPGKENATHIQNILNISPRHKLGLIQRTENQSLRISDIFSTISDRHTNSSLFSLADIGIPAIYGNDDRKSNESLISISSATELDLDESLDKSESTVLYEASEVNKRPLISVSLGVIDCDHLYLSTSNSNIKSITFTHKDNTNINCDINMTEFQETCNQDNNLTILSSESEEDHLTPTKRSVAVNLEIKKNKVQDDATENSKVLILNTNAIERLSHVVVQPPNYKLEKQSGKLKISGKKKKELNINRKRQLFENLKQSKIDRYFTRCTDVINVSEPFKRSSSTNLVVSENGEVMSKNLNTWDTGKGDRSLRQSPSKKYDDGGFLKPCKSCKGKTKSSLKRSPVSSSGPQSVKDGEFIQAPKKNMVSMHFNVPQKTVPHKSTSSKLVPYYKIVSGTNFAVDAFSYGDIPNIKFYFLTHFHSDHYTGLKKTFNKPMFCSKITAELCTSRIGVNPNHITILNIDETVSIDGVEVTTVDANHCPGAIMLIFTLPGGRAMLHTGDFRAAAFMESYPVFWDKDIHTVYLDTTYCNPRYDFPTQEQSLEMALYHLRQKKVALEKQGRSFLNVLIVCGTYTIGKEKFFLGMARRVGCSIWACPEKDRVLQVVEGRSFGHSTPQSCQLHVVPMRDLTHDKLRNYLLSLQGAFSEVVAFKPSGWENGKGAAQIKDNVTIYGIPYSEHSSFSELVRFVKFLRPKQVVPTVDIAGGVKSVQKFFPCPLMGKDELLTQNRLTDYFSIKPSEG